MKRLLFSICLILFLMLCGCGNTCNHKYEESVSHTASCESEGIKVHTCNKCGDSYTTAIPKTNHSYTDATCTTPMKCTKCGEVSGSALGHSFNNATCSAPATCSKCGETSGTAQGHTYEEATCFAPAKCSKCGETSGSAKGHSPVKDPSVPATCISAGKTEGSHCGECGTVIVSQQNTPLAGHSYVSGTCKVCGVTIKIQDASNTYLYYTKTLQVSEVVNGYFAFTCEAGHSTSGVNGMYNQKLVGYDSSGNQTFYAIVETYYLNQITSYIKYGSVPSTTTVIMVSDFY